MIYGRGNDRNSHIKEDGAPEFWKLLTIPIDDEDGEDILVDGSSKDCVYSVNGVPGILVRNDLNPLAKFAGKG